MSEPQPQGSPSEVSEVKITRRKAIAVAAAGAGIAGVAAFAGLHPTNAANPAKQPQSGTGPATPNPLSGTPVPDVVTQYAKDWPVVQGNLQSTRAANGSPINASNLNQLKSLWTVPITATGGFGGITATPVVIDQTIYFQDMQSNVFALDRATGKELWRVDYNVPNNGPDGVAVAYGMVFAATGDTSTAFAVDAKTGKKVWEAKLSNSDFECIDMAPFVYDNTVYISTNPNNVTNGNYRGGARGILYALDAASGKTLWSFDTATDNLWGNPRVNSGAGLWYPPSIDDEGFIYFGTGNPAPYPGNKQYPSGTSRPGPNDYADSLVSIDLATGGVRWHINANPHDLFDHDFQQSPVLATVNLNNTPTLIAVGAGKTGTVMAADAKTGAMLWKTPVGMHQNDQLQELPPGTTKVYPGGLGGVESPLAFGDGKIFAPYIDFPMYVTATGSDSTVTNAIANATGGLAAIDAATGQIVWDVKVGAMVVAGATVVNDVVLSGSLDGYMRAYNVKTGDKVWEFEAPAGLNAPPAVAGDMIVFASGAPIIVAPPQGGTPVPARKPNPQIVALKLG